MKTLLCAGALALLTASAAAKPGIAVSTVNLRADANTTSEILAKIPAGARLDVGGCTAGWCAVTFQGKAGFAIATALDASGRAPRPAVRRPPGAMPDDDDFEPAGPYPPGTVVGPRVYVGPPVYGPGPYWGPYWGPRWGYGWGWRRW
jgi:hypothetical protein